jgi:hypothetical protein
MDSEKEGTVVMDILHWKFLFRKTENFVSKPIHHLQFL